MNKQRIQKIIDFLETLKPDQFSLDVIVKESKNACGTICCIYGWFPRIFPEEFSWSIDAKVAYDVYQIGHGQANFQIVGDYLDISWAHASELFDVQYGSDDYDYEDSFARWLSQWSLNEEATPQEAADRLKDYMQCFG